MTTMIGKCYKFCSLDKACALTRLEYAFSSLVYARYPSFVPLTPRFSGLWGELGINPLSETYSREAVGVIHCS